LLAVRSVSAVTFELWQADPRRGTTTRITPAGGSGTSPVWLPDGRSFLFTSNREGRERIYLQQIGQVGEPRLIPSPDVQFQSPTGVTPDGRTAVLSVISPTTQFDLWAAPLDGSGAPALLLGTAAWEAAGTISPDGRWLAYVSDGTGQREVYVQAYPGPGPRVRVSIDGGIAPQWTQGGRELLYLRQEPSGASVIAVPIGTGETAQPGPPRVLFHRAGLIDFSVTADGERLLLATESGGGQPPSISLVLDWTAELKEER
jgi:Tol biopolymer transport system component